ncbi:NUDIX domain-containing protein [Priestia taiwanensis]|uniref:DNA mismatch repair protein MutT n=1 Tax=Priestia taiwanensis TaxID=1347902 RepID=A0A917EMB6_9BACI|nr:NUDIX domain-containing protein [Priestia taiwanensis]MBM7362185.1 ADP-ribose pyrophosphatase YjhB (NUDIX family) [Priestia taiwanensis]GGE60070.1 DNA mismatch repair protein MutT [Priestia taiwanensis]
MEIRNSVKVILIYEDKLLVTTYEGGDGVYHLLPGGGQTAGETLVETLKRECLEETGFQVEEGELLFIRECFMDAGIHRVEFMYVGKLVSLVGSDTLQMDHKQTDVSWLPVENLLDYPLFPVELRKLIMEFHKGNTENPVYVGEIK